MLIHSTGYIVFAFVARKYSRCKDCGGTTVEAPGYHERGEADEGPIRLPRVG